MKKTMKMAAMAAGVLLLAGCGNKAVDNSGDNGAKNAREMAQEQTQGGSGVISSIKDAMGLGKTMECTYTIKDGMGPGKDVVSKAYVNGKKYKAINELDGKKTISLFDEKAIYSWNEEDKTGTKMENACLEELSKSVPEKETGSKESLGDEFSREEDFEDAMDVKCEEASGVDFSVPADVDFKDQCELMRNLMKNIPSDANMPKGMPENMPSGVNIPNMNIPE